MENILQNYDEFTYLRDFKSLDTHDPEAVEAFKEAHFLTDEDMAAMQQIDKTVEIFNLSLRAQFD